MATNVEAEKNTGPHRSWVEHHEIQEGLRGDRSNANENENEDEVELKAAIHEQICKKRCFKDYTETEQQLEEVKEKKNNRHDNAQRSTVVDSHGESAASTTGPGLGHARAALEAKKNTGPHRSWGEHHTIQEGSQGDRSDTNSNENEDELKAAIHE